MGNGRVAFAVFALALVLLPPIFAQEGVEGFIQGREGNEEGFGGSGWFSDWRALSIIAIVISISLVALAYMASKVIGSQELSAWAAIEMVQVVGSALIVLALIGTIQFIDLVSAQIVNSGAYPVFCPPGELCTRTVANAYLDDLLSITNRTSSDVLERSVKYAALTRTGLQGNMQILLWAGYNKVPGAGQSLLVDKMGFLFDMLSKIAASLHGQKAFLNIVAFNIGPAFILLGVVLRTFFFTRKLGGLLLAVAVALMVVLPLLYAFSWFTLKVAVFGPAAIGPAPGCPVECIVQPAYAFDAITLDVYNRTSYIRNGWEQNGPPPQIRICENTTANNGGGCESCPVACREVPFPTYVEGCEEAACALCADECKIRRPRFDCADPLSPSYCPAGPPPACLPEGNICDPADQNPNPACCSGVCDATTNTCTECDSETNPNCSPEKFCANECKITNPRGLEPLPIPPPAVPDVPDCTACLGANPQSPGADGPCPHYCRVYNSTHSESADPSCTAVAACSANACPAVCRTKLPAQGTESCDAQCQGCPDFCRMDLGALFLTEPYRTYCSTLACNSCPIYCKTSAPPLPPSGECAPFPDTVHSEAMDCQACPLSCRANPPESAPPDCFEEPTRTYCFGLDPEFCPQECRVDFDYRVCNGDDMCGSGCYPAYRTLGLHSERNAYPDGSGCSYPECQEGCAYQRVSLPGGRYEGPPPPWPIDPARNCANCPYSCRFENLPAGAVCPAEACDDSYCPNKPNAEVPNNLDSYCGGYVGLERNGQGEIIPIGGYDPPGDPYGVPQPGDHEVRRIDSAVPPRESWSACGYCPQGCRFEDPENSNCWGNPYLVACLQEGYHGTDGIEAADSGEPIGECPLYCRHPAPPTPSENELCQPLETRSCAFCPAYCRVQGISLPAGLCGEECSPERCAGICKSEAPPKAPCDSCLECEEDCTALNPVRTDCSDVCDPALAGMDTFSPSSFITAIGAEGDTDTKNLGVLAIPALVLPLFIIVMLVAFIRVLSPVLGGDIEIPGITKLI